MRGVGDPEDLLVRDRLSALAWLISTGKLDIRLALRVDPLTARLQRGIYHEKFGIFTDEYENHVVFTGSQNETEGGLLGNFESIDVFCSWQEATRRIERKLRAFDRLWSNDTRGLAVIEFRDVTREILERFRSTSPPEFDPEEVEYAPGSRKSIRDARLPRIPQGIQIRDYQETAVQNWLRNNGRGILEMATGTGKTITALAGVTRLCEGFGLQGVIVVCPFKHLVRQWAKECKAFGFDPLLALESRQRWFDELTDRLAAASRGQGGVICVIATNATFSGDAFQQRLRYFPDKTVLVADEVHNLGAERLSAALPDRIGIRLGLSATPERWFDAKGTNRLVNYFGPILEPRLGIREAIDLKVLTPYRYYPVLVELTEDESERYLELSRRISALYFAKGDEGNLEDEALKSLLMQRARLVGAARNKLDALRAIARSKRNETHMLIYCGDGSVESDVDDAIARQVDEATRILGAEVGMRVAKYTAETDLDARDSHRKRLESGDLQALVAIRCLDEGLDIPAVRTAVILASSSNPRQFIQRRGRVLRRAPGKEFAEIHDMLVVPPAAAMAGDAERGMLRRELRRFVEFADLSLNAGEARQVVLGLQKRFDLTDM
jgi:DNA phosphorothioation system restriction enzyme